MNASKPIRVLIVGTGYFSQFHYDAWMRIDCAEVVAICDINIDCALSAAEQYKVDHFGANLSELIKVSQPDLIDIITPPTAHHDLVSKAIEHGVDVVVQKPFAGSYAAAKNLTELANSAGTKLIVHENFRFMPWYRKVKQLLGEHLTGELLNVRFDFRPGDGQGPGAYLQRQPYFQQMEKFLVHETAIHYIDVFRYLFGEIEHVYADLRQYNPTIRGEDAGLIVFGMKNDLRAIFDGNRLLDHQASDKRKTLGGMLIEGTKATIRLDGEARLWLRKFNELEEIQIPYVWNDAQFGGDCVFSLIEHVVNHYRQGTKLENQAAEYLVNLNIEEAIYCSNNEKRRVTL